MSRRRRGVQANGGEYATCEHCKTVVKAGGLRAHQQTNECTVARAVRGYEARGYIRAHDLYERVRGDARCLAHSAYGPFRYDKPAWGRGRGIVEGQWVSAWLRLALQPSLGLLPPDLDALFADAQLREAMLAAYVLAGGCVGAIYQDDTVPCIAVNRLLEEARRAA